MRPRRSDGSFSALGGRVRAPTRAYGIKKICASPIWSTKPETASRVRGRVGRAGRGGEQMRRTLVAAAMLAIAFPAIASAQCGPGDTKCQMQAAANAFVDCAVDAANKFADQAEPAQTVAIAAVAACHPEQTRFAIATMADIHDTNLTDAHILKREHTIRDKIIPDLLESVMTRRARSKARK